VQAACGFTDTPEAMYDYLLAAAGEGADPDLVRVYCDHSLDLFEWLVSLGMRFKGSFLPGKRSSVPTEDGLYYSGSELQAEFQTVAEPAPRGHHVQAAGKSGKAFWAPLLAGVEASSAKVLYSARGVSLLVEDGERVTGVVAEVEGQERQIRASRAVILTAGGFGANRGMIARHCPELLRTRRHVGTRGDDGSGIKMGQTVGGDVRMMSSSFAYLAPYQFDPVLVKGILVDDKGQRFVAEDHYGSFIGGAIVRHRPTAYLVVDSDIWDQIPERWRRFLPKAAQADTIAGLGTELGIVPKLLERTVRVYNEFVGQGRDLEFEKAQEYLVPVDCGPFFAVRFLAKYVTYFTTGGLRINSRAQVLDASGQPIEGLFAAGRTAFAVTARNYPASGTAIGECLIFGRIAGKEAAAVASWC
jgi:3-oxo-5alpha-steroid 4-dehydrogenase